MRYHVEIVRMCIVWGFDPDSIDTLDSHRWRLPGGESWKIFIWSCL